MFVTWLIAIASLVGWIVGSALLPEFRPWIHVLLVIAGIAFGLIFFRRGRHVQQRA